MPFIPKNARQILNNPTLQRQFFLKPYGLETPKNSNFPKKHPQYKFFEHKILLYRPGKNVSNNTLTFKVKETISKPELKQYLTKLYGWDIQKINTARFMGKVVRDYKGKMQVTSNWKKAFVITNHEIDPILNTPLY